MKKNEMTPHEREMTKVVKPLTKRDLIHIRAPLEKAEAFLNAILQVANGDGLEEMGDKEVAIVLDQGLCELMKVREYLDTFEKKAA